MVTAFLEASQDLAEHEQRRERRSVRRLRLAIVTLSAQLAVTMVGDTQSR
ncbi:hypothetical protein [Streptomyces sp. NPDC087859]